MPFLEIFFSYFVRVKTDSQLFFVIYKKDAQEIYQKVKIIGTVTQQNFILLSLKET